jgi:hypothetical protein
MITQIALSACFLTSALAYTNTLAPATCENQNSTSSLFDCSHHPTPSLVKLMTLLGMEEEPKDLSTINTWAQTHLLRKGERWDPQTDQFEHSAPQITSLLAQLGFMKAVDPSRQTYEGALFYGSLLSSTRVYLHYLIEQWNKGVRFKHLYILSGARPLEPSLENPEALLSDNHSPLKIRSNWIAPTILPRTESEMMVFVWEQAELPEDMRTQMQLHVIDAPMKLDLQTGKLTRPTRDDTLQLWVQSAPTPGHYLAVSRAPYIVRQAITAEVVVPQEYIIDTVGLEIRPQTKMILILDELARAIFQLTILAQQEQH